MIEEKLEMLQNSKFRSSFTLKEKDILYVQEKGLEKIEKHACDFIRKRLAPLNLSNDGKQTPMKGHPVFVAQHATACCCRKCLYKWHQIPMYKELTTDEQQYIVKIIMMWIQKQFSNKTNR